MSGSIEAPVGTCLWGGCSAMEQFDDPKQGVKEGRVYTPGETSQIVLKQCLASSGCFLELQQVEVQNA